MLEPQLTSTCHVADSRVSRRRFLVAAGASLFALATAAHEMGAQMTDLIPLLNRVTFGAYAASEPWPDVSQHFQLEQQLGTGVPTMSWFQNFQNGWLVNQSTVAAQSGHALQIALAPCLDDGRAVPFADILNGMWDRRLDLYFRGAAAYPHDVVIRLAHEMNMGQHRWSILNAAPCTNSLDVWLATWRYIVDRQRRIGGSVKWQWCVNSLDMGGVPAEAYWPGADYVDIIAIDVYNGYGPWTSGWKLIQPMYDRVTQLDPTAPVWLAELGCRQVYAGETWSKATWFSDLFASTAFPRLSTIVFFHAMKEYDWRITTDDVRAVMSTLLQNAGAVPR